MTRPLPHRDCPHAPFPDRPVRFTSPSIQVPRLTSLPLGSLKPHKPPALPGTQPHVSTVRPAHSEVEFALRRAPLFSHCLIGSCCLTARGREGPLERAPPLAPGPGEGRGPGLTPPRPGGAVLACTRALGGAASARLASGPGRSSCGGRRRE